MGMEANLLCVFSPLHPSVSTQLYPKPSEAEGTGKGWDEAVFALGWLNSSLMAVAHPAHHPLGIAAVETKQMCEGSLNTASHGS